MDPYIPVLSALLGAGCGSVLTFCFAFINNKISKIRDERFSIFKTLLAKRNEQFSFESAQAVSAVPALFWNKSNVMTSYRHLCALVPNGWNVDFHRRYYELVIEIGAALGYGKISEADFNLGFFPLPPPQNDGV